MFQKASSFTNFPLKGSGGDPSIFAGGGFAIGTRGTVAGNGALGG